MRWLHGSYQRGSESQAIPVSSAWMRSWIELAPTKIEHLLRCRCIRRVRPVVDHRPGEQAGPVRPRRERPEIPALRPNLYGRFTINLGVWLPGLTKPGSRAPAQHSTHFINDYNCHLRARIGELLPEAADTWWRLSAPADQLAAIVSSAITGHALPWLARFSTWDDTLRQLEAAPADPNWFMSPPRLTAMRMWLARGEHAAAERDFAEHMDAWMKNPRTPSHLEFLAEIAAQHSFKVEVAAATAGAPRQ